MFDDSGIVHYYLRPIPFYKEYETFSLVESYFLAQSRYIYLEFDKENDFTLH